MSVTRTSHRQGLDKRRLLWPHLLIILGALHWSVGCDSTDSPALSAKPAPPPAAPVDPVVEEIRWKSDHLNWRIKQLEERRDSGEFMSDGERREMRLEAERELKELEKERSRIAQMSDGRQKDLAIIGLRRRDSELHGSISRSRGTTDETMLNVRIRYDRTKVQEAFSALDVAKTEVKAAHDILGHDTQLARNHYDLAVQSVDNAEKLLEDAQLKGDETPVRSSPARRPDQNRPGSRERRGVVEDN